VEGFEWVEVAQVGASIRLTWEPLGNGFVQYQVWAGGHPDQLQQVVTTSAGVKEYHEPAIGSSMRYHRVVGITSDGTTVTSELQRLWVDASSWNLSPSVLTMGEFVTLHGVAKAGETVTVQMMDVLGKTGSTSSTAAAADGKIKLELSTAGMAAGLYFARVAGESLLFVIR
jgi:hypothetical protein